jgi:hypothetical protein
MLSISQYPENIPKHSPDFFRHPLAARAGEPGRNPEQPGFAREIAANLD